LGDTFGDSPASSGPALPLGPPVPPGAYTVSLTVPGVARELKATLKVEADPRITASEGERRTRHAALLKLYDPQRTRGTARSSARNAADQMEARRRTAGTAPVDAAAKLSQLQSDIAAQLAATTNLARAIEGYSGAPTADQQRQVAWALDDGSRVVS